MANWTWHKDESDTKKFWFRAARQVMALVGQYLILDHCYVISDKWARPHKKLSEKALKTALTVKGMGVALHYRLTPKRFAYSCQFVIHLSDDAIELYIPARYYLECARLHIETKKTVNHLIGVTHLILEGNYFWFNSVSDNETIIHPNFHKRINEVFAVNGLMSTGYEVK